MNAPGLFITLEGGEGTGKSTQCALLAESLRARGHDAVTTREPGGTPEAEKIRELLVSRDGGRWSPMAETLLFFAARVMHVETLIKPALAAGKIIICDRFTDSTRAYQCHGHGMPSETVESLVSLALEGFEPDLTFILDIEPRTGLDRASRRLQGQGSVEDRFENLDIAFHERLRRGYVDIARRAPDRCVLIDAAQSLEAVAQALLERTLQKLSLPADGMKGALSS